MTRLLMMALTLPTWSWLDGERFTSAVATSMLEEGESVTIPRGVLYHDEGNMMMLAISIPPFEHSRVRRIRAILE